MMEYGLIAEILHTSTACGWFEKNFGLRAVLYRFFFSFSALGFSRLVSPPIIENGDPPLTNLDNAKKNIFSPAHHAYTTNVFTFYFCTPSLATLFLQN